MKHLIKYLVLFLVSSTLLACEEAPSDQASTIWPDVLKSFPVNPAAIYAPAFVSEPADGQFLRVSLHEGSTREACSAYSNDFSTKDTDGFFLRVSTNRYTHGQFAIVELPSSGPALEAQVRLIQSRGGLKVATYPASGGVLKVHEVPESLADARNGGRVRLELHARFADDPVVQSECSTVGNKDGTEVVKRCDCTRSSGNKTSCVPSEGHSGCCESPAAGKLAYDVEVVADLCAPLCAFTDPALAHYCQELQR